VQLLRQAGELQSEGRKVSVAIGMFDGVHLGHQQVIKQTIADVRQHKALALAITFDKHPSAVLAPAKAPRLIYSLEQKLREIERLGVDAILLIEFTKKFSEQPADQFICGLSRDIGQIYSICVGSNFTFGHKRAGNVDLLKTLGGELGFQVHGLAAVSLAGQIVSSTRIRERIGSGDLDSASQMLGRTYSIFARVIRGDQLGRKLAFPTANLEIGGVLTPPNGVYAAIGRTDAGEFQGVVNLGIRPTLEQTKPELRFELHLLEFDGDLYDQFVEVVFVQFIRSELRFANLDELKGQIARDVSAARKCFG
jgi:riboflavin kinase/FMN adenylyltransferase